MQTVIESLKSREIRMRIMFTLVLLAIYRFGTFVPAPGVDRDALGSIDSGALGFLNLFSGGAVERFSLFALGIMPYITASIVIQLLGVVSSKMSEIKKEGETGANKLNQYTRYLTVALALAQAIIYVFLFRSQGDVFPELGVLTSVSVVVALVAGSVFVMFLGENITQRGVGNGISLIVFAGIVSKLPSGLDAYWNNPDGLFKIVLPLVILLTVLIVVFVQEGQRKIPVQYSRQGSRKQISYLPLRLNMANVIPVIFASSLITIPAMLGASSTGTLKDIADFLAPNSLPYLGLEFILILTFAYFYAGVIFNPKEQAENLNRSQASIPGIRPGKETEKFLDQTLFRLTVPGALFLASVALIPTLIVRETSSTVFFSGVSVIIVIGVALEVARQLESRVRTKNYEKLAEKPIVTPLSELRLKQGDL